MSTGALKTAKQTVCDLCGLPLPTRPVSGRDERNYCCSGCAHVDAILNAVGPESEKGRKALLAARNRGLISASESNAEIPDLPSEVREEKRLRIEGMACPSCSWLVESVISDLPGVARAEVDYFSDTAKVVFDLSKTDVDEITRVVDEAGYHAGAIEEVTGEGDRKDLIRLAVAVFIALNQMMLAWVGYGIIFGEGAWVSVVAWMQLITAVPVVTWSAVPLYKRAFAAIRRGKVVMETLLSLGIMAATALSLASFITAQPHLYFETATMLVALSLAGRASERCIKKRTADSLTELLRFAPTKARRDTNGHFQPLDHFSRGDRIRVQEGEVVPLDIRADNEIVVREGLLTGEPHPQFREAGNIILAGSTVEQGILTGSVEREAGASVAQSMQERVMEALRSADAGSRLADRLAQGFVPLVVIVALGAFFWHLFTGAALPAAALIAVSVLVVSCPCAFGVAASSALSLAVLRLAKAGVLVKDASIMERVGKLNRLFFDKTGTITCGEISIIDTVWISGEDRQLMGAVKAVEQSARHPVGVSLARLLPGDAETVAEGVVELPAMGITGTVNGRRIAVGKIDLFAQLDRPVTASEGSISRVWFGYAGEKPSGYIDIADSIRIDARIVVHKLESQGIRTGLLSGDDHRVTASIAGAAGINDAEGGLGPEKKSALVNQEKSANNTVGFVGDGFNDAEAIASSDIGFAMASGADLAMISAPIVITGNDLTGITKFIKTAKQAVNVLRGNFAWAFLYNFAMIPVAAFGLLTPVHAALLMALSSASVAFNSARLRKEK